MNETIDTKTLAVLILWGLRKEKRRGYPRMKPSFVIQKELIWKDVYNRVRNSKVE